MANVVTKIAGAAASVIEMFSVVADGSTDVTIELGFTPSRVEVLNTTDDSIYIKTPGMLDAEAMLMSTASQTMTAGSLVTFVAGVPASKESGSDATGNGPTVVIDSSITTASDIVIVTAWH